MSPLEFTNVERMASTGVIIADDGLTENKEYFSVQLVDMVLRLGDKRLLLSNQEKVRIMLDETNITIMDNDSKFSNLLPNLRYDIMCYQFIFFRSSDWIPGANSVQCW